MTQKNRKLKEIMDVSADVLGSKHNLVDRIGADRAFELIMFLYGLFDEKNPIIEKEIQRILDADLVHRKKLLRIDGKNIISFYMGLYSKIKSNNLKLSIEY